MELCQDPTKDVTADERRFVEDCLSKNKNPRCSACDYQPECFIIKYSKTLKKGVE